MSAENTLQRLLLSEPLTELKSRLVSTLLDGSIFPLLSRRAWLIYIGRGHLLGNSDQTCRFTLSAFQHIVAKLRRVERIVAHHNNRKTSLHLLLHQRELLLREFVVAIVDSDEIHAIDNL